MAWLPWLVIGPFPDEWLDVPLAGFGLRQFVQLQPQRLFYRGCRNLLHFLWTHFTVDLWLYEQRDKNQTVQGATQYPAGAGPCAGARTGPAGTAAVSRSPAQLQLCPAVRGCRTSRELFPPQNLPWMSPQPSAVPKGRGEAAAALVCTGSLLKSLKPLTPNSWKQRKKTFPSLDVFSSSSWTGFLFTTNQLNLLISEKKNHFDHKAWLEVYKEQNTLKIPLQVKQMNAAVQRDRAQEAVCPLSRAREPFPWLNRNRSPLGKGRLMALNYQSFGTDTLATSEPEKHLCTCQGTKGEISAAQPFTAG